MVNGKTRTPKDIEQKCPRAIFQYEIGIVYAFETTKVIIHRILFCLTTIFFVVNQQDTLPINSLIS
jgi:hypothetical protein